MKSLLITLLCSLFIGGIHAQPTLPGDMLAEDFRYLVHLLEETHPDPYTGFGGKVFFCKAAFDLEHRLRQAPATLKDFHEQASAFLSNLKDGHTYLFAPSATSDKAPARWFPLNLRVIPDGIIVSALPTAQRTLLGSRLTAVEGHPLDKVLARAATLEGCENLYGRYNLLSINLPAERFARQLFPQLADSLHLTLLTPDNREETIALPPLTATQYQQQPPAGPPAQENIPEGQLQYGYIDPQQEVMYINIDRIMARDNFEYMYRQHWPDMGQQLAFYYREMGLEMPADTLQAISSLPSFSGTFAAMLEKMKHDRAHTLVIDLRSNGGGWTPIVYPTLYQLYGSRFVQADWDTQSYRLVSPLLLQKFGISGQEFRQGDQTWKVGEYTFTAEEPDTTDTPEADLCRLFVENCMSSVPEKLEAQQGEAVYTPQHVYVVTDAGTFSAAFHYAFYLWKMGATVVGVPSAQAPNTFMEQTSFRLPRTGLTGSISNSIQIFLPGTDRRAKTFYPDWMPAYEDYKKYGFDRNAELLYLLERINKH